MNLFRSLTTLLLLLRITSCDTHPSLKNQVRKSLDSLLILWTQQYEEAKTLKEDSLLFIHTYHNRNLMRNLLRTFQHDTLSTAEWETLHNFFAAQDCFEKNYFLWKKKKYEIRYKMSMLEYLKQDIETHKMTAEAGLQFLRKEKDSWIEFHSNFSKMKSEYIRCRSLMKTFFRESLQIYSRYHAGHYPVFLKDSVPEWP